MVRFPWNPWTKNSSDRSHGQCFSRTGPRALEMILWTGLWLLSQLLSVDYNFWETNDRFDKVVNLFEVRFLRLFTAITSLDYQNMFRAWPWTADHWTGPWTTDLIYNFPIIVDFIFRFLLIIFSIQYFWIESKSFPYSAARLVLSNWIFLFSSSVKP